MRNAEFNDPALVEVYDAQCLWGEADELFLALANEVPHARILDLGCGTGRLTLDPAKASLDAARIKQGTERVNWIQGTSALLSDMAFDLVFMTSHVAQFFTNDTAWAATLNDLRRALVPGGRLIFDARDPAARSWEQWNPNNSRETVALGQGRSAEIWTEVVEKKGEMVTLMTHYLFSDSPEEKLALLSLSFRSEEALRTSLMQAGFEIEQIYGGWNRKTVGQGSGEFIVLARAR